MAKKKTRKPVDVTLAMIPAPETLTEDEASEWLCEWAEEYIELASEGYMHMRSLDRDTLSAYAFLSIDVGTMIAACAVAAREKRPLRVTYHHENDPDDPEFRQFLSRIARLHQAGPHEGHGGGLGDAARQAMAGRLVALCEMLDASAEAA